MVIGKPLTRHRLAAVVAALAVPVALGLAGCGSAPPTTPPDRHARAAEGCMRTLDRNGWRDVTVVSAQGIGGFEVQVILQDAGGFKKVCRYDTFNDTAFVQLP